MFDSKTLSHTYSLKMLKLKCLKQYNYMAYETWKFNAAFTKALQ